MEDTPSATGSKESKWRPYIYIWLVRFAQFILAIVVLAEEAEIASQWSGIGCGAPRNIAYVVAISSITLPLLLYIILTTGPFCFLWYHFWSAVAFDSVLLVLWTVVAAVANTYTCSGICSACPAGETYYIHTLACDCYQGYYKRGDVDPDVPEIEEGFNDLPNRAYEARTTGPAGVEIILIFATLIWTIVLHQRIEKSKTEARKANGVLGVELGSAGQSQCT